MRQMPLLSQDSGVDGSLIGVVQACMMYPDDQDSIDEDTDVFRLRAKTGRRDTQLGKRFQAEWRSSNLGGMYAGEILFKMIVFDTHRPELRISFNKATYAVALEMHEVGQGLDRNLSTVKGYWSTYKNAAHLWAALMLTFDRGGREFPVDFLSLVTIGERLAERASHLVGDWNPWRAPPDFPFDGSTVVIEPPSPEQVENVSSYKVGKK